MIGRIPIEEISPVVLFGGEFVPVKAVPNETLTISATVFREGHNGLGVQAILLDEQGREVERTRMREIWPGTDRYEGQLTPPSIGEFSFLIEAFDDPYLTWQHDSEIKISANIDAELCCDIGAELFEEKITHDPTSKTILEPVLTALKNETLAPANRFSIAGNQEIRSFFYTNPLRRLVTASRAFPIRADRHRALVGAWYEFFPRSEGASLQSSGTFATASKRLSQVAAMGFDVLYLPPIHPIGQTFRKGANNSLESNSSDPGVPWAIGSKEGGHDGINPSLGSIKDFEAFVKKAKKLNLEIALDFALQASPDHPWVKEHPNWFTRRPDGSIACAENPPKKYQDIYPINFDEDLAGIIEETVRILRFWIDKGVTAFRVDNPHTKPVKFWQEVLAIVFKESPEVIFLAEAFTRPPMMHALGKAGFHQSYTYFTWRTSKQELTAYGNEVAHSTSAFFRPNFWVNTPDILPFHLQSGLPSAFALRAVLAATLSPSWGMYAGYELYEHLPLRPDSEEYLDSEKYQIKIRDWEKAGKEGRSLAPFVTQLNEIRRKHPALQLLRNLVFHDTDSEAILAYSKREGSDLILVVVNLDPISTQETIVHWDMNSLGLSTDNFFAHDLLDGSTFEWQPDTFVRLNPSGPSAKVAHIVYVNVD